MSELSNSLIVLSVFVLLSAPASAEVFRKRFSIPSAYLIVEILDDDLVHFEVSALGTGPDPDRPLYASPMVLRADYPGPGAVSDQGNVLETAEIRLEVDPANLCVAVRDKARGNAYLTTLCPADLNRPFKGLNVDPGAIQHVYGLGQEFKNRGSADGDWIELGIRQGLEFGNGFQGFQSAAVGNVQIPVMYALGPANLNYALFLDNVYRQRWDFTTFWWEVRMFGDHLRFFLMTGPHLADLRADYLELTGRPPVPPRKAFGLWVSEFGYDRWDEIETLRDGLRDQGFPLDGFVLDLNWFGGVDLDDPAASAMGRLDWDQDPNDGNPYFFPDPQARIRTFAADELELTAIEESYLNFSTDTFAQMPNALTAYERRNGRCDPADQDDPVTGVQGFWGRGRMIDWSDPAAGAWFHANRRYPNLVEKGVNAHWTDLGEPETFDSGACYEGVEITNSGPKNEHSDIHNLYNLLWNKSIWDGYFSRRGRQDALDRVNRRPFIVTRSGAAGSQRFGAAMWSGDIASNLESLATHLNAQLHMSFSGIDYYGADIGGFRREVLPYNDRQGRYRGYEAELYTQWFAAGAWFDVPVRPHTDNEFVRVEPPYATAPHLVGHLASNLANLRQRYALIPYYYALAYRAHLFGEPVVPPLVFYYQNDPNVRRIGHEKLIGRDLLVAVVARHGEYERDVYLPPGKWIGYHTNEWFDSAGQILADVPVYRDGLFRLPVFARAGAIVPRMAVDENTKDAFGNRRDAAPRREELIVRVYPDSTASGFTLYEDDGATLGYRDDGRPVYHHRTTALSQRRIDGETVEVTLHPAVDVNGEAPFSGAVTSRRNVIELVVENAEAIEVSLNGVPLTQRPSRASFEFENNGWLNAGRNLILAKSEVMDVYGPAKTFTFRLQAAAPATSVSFVCDRGFTVPGESIYVAGSLPGLGSWDPARAIRVDPNVYYEYVDGVNPPPGHNGPGPSAPVWTGVIFDLPPNTTFEWKCLRRREDGSGEVAWEPGANNAHTTTASGYAGRSYGSF